MNNQAVAVQPFLAHIQEVRRRILWLAALMACGSLAGYMWRLQLINWLQRPLSQPLFYNSPAGGFEFSLNISLIVGLIVIIPAITYHLIRFIEPALPIDIRRGPLLLIISSSLGLAAAGLAFAYWVVLPMSLHFFAGFGQGGIKPLIAAKDYLSFVTACLASFAIMFQLPLIILFIDRIKPLPPKQMKRYRRHIIVGSLLIAVVLPFTYDPVTQFVIAVPMIGLYELSLILLWTRHRKLNNKAHRQTNKLNNAKNTDDSLGWSTKKQPQTREMSAAVNITQTEISKKPRARVNILDLRKITHSQGKLSGAKTVLSERDVSVDTSKEEKQFAGQRIGRGDGGALRKSSIDGFHVIRPKSVKRAVPPKRSYLLDLSPIESKFSAADTRANINFLDLRRSF